MRERAIKITYVEGRISIDGGDFSVDGPQRQYVSLLGEALHYLLQYVGDDLKEINKHED